MKTPVLKTAKSDIPVKKVLRKTMYSPFYNFYWEQGNVRTLDDDEQLLPKKSLYRWDVNPAKKIMKVQTGWEINNGFHSCKDIYRLESWDEIYFSSQPSITFGFYLRQSTYNSTGRKMPELYAVFDAVIPKGGNYYVNERGEYVSDRLMIVGKVKTVKTIK